LNKPRILL